MGDEPSQSFEALIELKSMNEYCANEKIKNLLNVYFDKWEHEPLDAKQLINFVDEQELNDKYSMINFEMLSKLFRQYERYKDDVEVNNAKIQKELAKKDKRHEFDCKKILDLYVEKHGEPKDLQMFYRYVREIGHNDVEFKQVEEQYNKIKGIKK